MSAVLDAPPALDPLAMRRTLGRFATGITVISARAPSGEEAAITANSFTSVSLDPPLVLWSVARDARSASTFQCASHFVVHILSERQRSISQHFACRQADKLGGVAHTRDADGGLELPGWLARLTCEPYRSIEAGDHWLVMARVVSMAHTEDRPLLYFGGGYRTLGPHAPP